MICSVCGNDNKEGLKLCKKCGVDVNIEPLWRPTWKWHAGVLGLIYVVLVIAYFAISKFLTDIPEPYRMREIPAEVTPWLKK